MISSSDLLNRLNDIERCYNSEADPIKALLWAKLAIIEVSGWTEECIDKMINDFLNSKNPPSKTLIIEKLNKIYGFHYKKDFKEIWITIIGIILFDKIESNKSRECQQLETALNKLKEKRDSNAHTYVKQTSIIDAPSITKHTLQQIETGLLAFNSELANLSI